MIQSERLNIIRFLVERFGKFSAMVIAASKEANLITLRHSRLDVSERIMEAMPCDVYYPIG